MNDMRHYINLIESAQHEQLDELDLKKAAATAMAVGALAGAPQDAQASTDAAQGIDTNQPVATQQVTNQQFDVKQYNQQASKSFKVDKDIWLNRYRLKDYGISNWYGFQTGDNVFAPGLTVEQMMPYVKKIHNSRPDFLGKATSNFNIVQSDHNKSEAMGVIEYENGKLEIHMVQGGKVKSALAIGKLTIDGAKVGNDKKYIMTFLNWHTKQSRTAPTGFSLD